MGAINSMRRKISAFAGFVKFSNVSTFKGIEVMAEKMTEGERASLQAELEHLRQEHRDLDSAIEALLHLGAGDQLQIQRLKKRKLILRDRLCFIEDKLTPDIIA